uniref:Bifunctional inhibitor/plant lipid transfer protein/seed storage helical domain-containing protein n=1 Tax=Kalanchoe fedtschenkoi TaxID=63787 RepID=A0A7N0V104_KALFE
MSSRLAFILLAALLLLLLADLAASQSPTASPSPAPSKKKKTPVSVPTASPAPTVPESSAPAPSGTDAGTDCMTLLFGAADCLSYVQEGSNLTVPDKACCPELATLVNTNPICLCQLLNKGDNSLGIAIDMKRALALPSACKVQTPDPSLCALINGSPAGAPGLPPTDGVPPTGAALPPSSVNNDNGASAIGTSATSFVVALVAVAAFTWNMF